MCDHDYVMLLSSSWTVYMKDTVSVNFWFVSLDLKSFWQFCVLVVVNLVYCKCFYSPLYIMLWFIFPVARVLKCVEWSCWFVDVAVWAVALYFVGCCCVLLCSVDIVRRVFLQWKTLCQYFQGWISGLDFPMYGIVLVICVRVASGVKCLWFISKHFFRMCCGLG